MPRPKVPLADRQRAVQACRLCKSSKKRCNATLPCSNCVRRGKARECSFPDIRLDEASSARDGPSSASPASTSTPHLTGGSGSVGDRASRARAVKTRAQNAKASGPPDGRVGPESSSRGEAAHKTRPRLLSNARGEKVYVGGSASLSFLQLVRDTVTQCIGHTDFSDYAARDRMIEAEMQVNDSTDDEALDDVQQQYEFIDLFMVSTSGIIRLLTNEEAIQMVFTTREESNRIVYAIGRLILAIGAQCSERTRENIRREKRYFAEAQKIAFTGMLQDPSLDIARAFLLMAFYMLGACRRNAGFMYLGIAARAAIALGLHNFETYRPLLEPDRDVRTRAWESIVTLDHMVSSILGRPSATCLDRTSPDDRGKSRASSSLGDLEDGDDTSFTAAYQLSIRIDEIVAKLYGKRVASVESAQAELRALRQWSENLPDELRFPSVSQYVEKEAQKRVIGCLHVSCFYYFAVMLVTRPFFIGYLTKRLAAAQTAVSNAENTTNGTGDSQMADVAQACLSAAVNMAQLCSEVQEAGFLFENMRILKAWIFAAALVLGFQMFAISQQDEEVEEAFKTAHTVLKKLSHQSVQAAHYFDIITYLSNAILKQRQMQASKKRRSNDLVVDKIMSLRPPARSDEWAAVSDDADQSKVSDVTDPQDRWLENLQLEAQGFFPLMDDSSLGWENAALQFWDQFPIDSQPLDSLEMPLIPM